MMRKLIFSIALFLLCFEGKTQGLYLDNSNITVQNNASITIQGELDAKNNGAVENSGTVQVRNDIINNSGGILFTNENSGVVLLYGDDQTITGADSTVFYNLYFDGDVLSEKSFQIPSAILNELDLNNQIMETNDNRVFLMNANQNALYFNQGFITSNSLGGYFVRATNSTNEYLFPVGSIHLTPHHRMINIFPQTSDTNYFEVRLSPVGSAIDNSGVSASGAVGPFDTNSKEFDLGTINNIYYHNIHQLSGNALALVELYWNSTDGDFKTLAQWKNGQYYDVSPSMQIENAFGLDRKMILKDFSDYQDDVFALASLNIIIDISNGVSPNSDGLNDFFNVTNLATYPENSLMIFNRWGDKVYEASPYENDWNGQNNKGGLGSEELPAGTYFYILELDEDQDPIKGYIELKR